MNSDFILDKVRGSIIGGAVGDTLGYAVEFIDRETILQEYGPGGITRYRLGRDGVVHFSDDTQMTLFTADGLIRGMADGFPGQEKLEVCITESYIEWLYTQKLELCPDEYEFKSNLMSVDGLYSDRAPGMTCLTTLRALARGEKVNNHSKGCGGVMRVAPIGLLEAILSFRGGSTDLSRLAAQSAYTTHKHPLGFIPAAMLAYIVRHLATLAPEDALRDMESIVIASCRAAGDIEWENGNKIGKLYQGYLSEMCKLVEKTVSLAHGGLPDAEAVAAIGEGWTGDEALAIAVFCCLRHADDFEKAIVAAVNHSGDSDSTGSIAGNIIGAALGRKAIPSHYTNRLELLPLIEQVSGDLAFYVQHGGTIKIC